MRLIVLGLVVVVPAVCAAQPSSSSSGPEPSHAMVRAAGMPLNDAALPAGTLTVRVVRGAFAGDLADLEVELEVAGRVERERTKADGRAEFAHLPIGATVRARATVDGQRLESQRFEVPAAAGVRLLLVAGGDPLPAPALPPGHPDVPAASAASMSIAPPVTETGQSGVGVVRKTLASATLLAFAALFFRRYVRR